MVEALAIIWCFYEECQKKLYEILKKLAMKAFIFYYVDQNQYVP